MLGCCLRPGDATLRTRSVLVVPPDFDGLLRKTRCRFFAPCSRPWGSPRFRFLAVTLCVALTRSVSLARLSFPLRGSAAVATFASASATPKRCSAALCDFWLTQLLVPSPAALYPSKLFPRRNPCHVTVVDAFSPLVSVVLPWLRPPVMGDAPRFAVTDSLTSRLCSFDESVSLSLALPPTEGPMLPWVSTPLQDRDACCDSLPRRLCPRCRSTVSTLAEARALPCPTNRDRIGEPTRLAGFRAGLVAFLEAANASTRCP